MRSLSLREQLLIALMLLVGVALGIFLVFQNHQKTEKQLSSRLEEKKLQLEQLQLLAREWEMLQHCLLYTSRSPRDYAASRMPSSA